ncbi:MAG TPA: DUF455 family protein [Verrucomicrobiae bacterium]|jgi:uncharacterized ferritin-like protein (DUF455 family)|nr:DUF455 family protein [Verrucomicrobiae bacterium]
MELRDFAERVLFATTLEEKLQSVAVVTDEHPGPALIAPHAPGRPAGLRFKAQGSGKADFPGVQHLEREQERGRLLHFFANHELLATELMALALLRFPDAPAAFRRGIWETLKDEQMHTRLYVQRMRQCGIEFGELPVSGYFWRSVAPMESPLDYVTRLSLTFEQANLDFCRHFAGIFQTAGDADTAKLLERVYRDEIGHVAYGLKWFRRWKNPGESDWDAFCRQLKFPLSPQRAKGLALNVEGRRAAGLDAAFVAELNIYSHSKGRTPNVLVFNPLAEGRIAHGRSFTPVKHQAALVRDLANLPQFLCGADDVVLVPKRPSVEFLSAVKQAGFPLPEFVELKNGGIDPAGNLSRRKLGRLRPWAWGPDSLELFQPIFDQVSGEARTSGQHFNERIARLYSKAWSAGFLKKVLTHGFAASSAAQPWLCSGQEVGVAVNTVDAALEAIAAIRSRGHHRIVAKEALGLAGRNAIRLWEPEVSAAQRQWLASAVQNSRQLVIEPWLERELDFSVQLEMGPRDLKLCGYTGLINDSRGQFQANWAAANYDRRVPAGVAALFRESGMAGGLQRLYGDIFSLLEKELREAGFVGPIGIDAFVYRTAEGGCRLKPVVEINPRYTMGRLTLELMKQTCPGSGGLFRLVSRAQARVEGFADFLVYAQALNERFPLRFEGDPTPRIREGALCLNDPAEAEVCLAIFQVNRNSANLGEVSGESGLNKL